MAAFLTDSKLQADGAFTVTGTFPPQGTASTSTLRAAPIRQSRKYVVSFTHGTGAGACNLYVCQQRTLAASTSETLNLFDGSLVGIAREATGFATIKFIQVFLIPNPSGATGATSITIGNAAADVQALWFGGDTHTASVFKDGPAFQQGDPTGKTVDNTNKNLLITNADGTNAATYQILIAGLSN